MTPRLPGLRVQRELAAVRYVITLDADTVLPRDGAAKLVGALAHPLNTARFSGATGRIAAGYTVRFSGA